MKKALFLIVLLIFFYGCKREKEPVITLEPDIKEVVIEEPEIKEEEIVPEVKEPPSPEKPKEPEIIKEEPVKPEIEEPVAEELETIKEPFEPEISEPLFRQLPNPAFRQGEKIHYSVKYGIIPAGTAILGVSRIKNYEGRESYEITAEARSARLYDLVYRVRNKYVTIMDKEGLFPWKHEQHIDVARKKSYIESVFKQTENKVIISGARDAVFEDAPDYCHDIISSLYYFRTLNFKVGDNITVPLNDMKKVYDMHIKVLKKEKVRTPIGRLDTYKVSVNLEFEGELKTKDSMFIWFTDDRRRLPVKIQNNLRVGSFTASLTKLEYN